MHVNTWQMLPNNLINTSPQIQAKPIDNLTNDSCSKQEKTTNVTLDHKTSLKSLGYICSNSQKYIVGVKIIFFNFMSKNH